MSIENLNAIREYLSDRMNDPSVDEATQMMIAGELGRVIYFIACQENAAAF